MCLTAPGSQTTLQLKKRGFAFYPGVPWLCKHRVHWQMFHPCTHTQPTPLQSLLATHLPTASLGPEVKEWVSSGASPLLLDLLMFSPQDKWCRERRGLPCKGTGGLCWLGTCSEDAWEVITLPGLCSDIFLEPYITLKALERARPAAALLEEEAGRSNGVALQSPTPGWAPSGGVASLGERWVQEMGMEKRVLLVLFSQKSHTSCSESQKGSLVLARTNKQGDTRSRTQTGGTRTSCLICSPSWHF